MLCEHLNTDNNEANEPGVSQYIEYDFNGDNIL